MWRGRTSVSGRCECEFAAGIAAVRLHHPAIAIRIESDSAIPASTARYRTVMQKIR
jgi:hypothetical protein